MFMLNAIFHRLQTRGPASLLRQFLLHWKGEHVYRRWLVESEGERQAAREAVRRELQGWDAAPLISILMPVYNTPEAWLREAIDSVLAQDYPNWQLCIADDASTAPHIRPLLERYAAEDPRIRITFRERNGGIAACSNSALALAEGAYAALLDHDDRLAPEALGFVAAAIRKHPNARFLYSDEDRLDARGRRCRPNRKQDWNPDLLLGQHYPNHLSTYRTDVLREIGGFREGFDGSQDYDLALRATACLQAQDIVHIPHILYHWRMAARSVSRSGDSATHAKNANHRALAEHLAGTGAVIEDIPPHGFHRIHWPLPKSISLEILLHGYANPLPLQSLPRTGCGGEGQGGGISNTHFPTLGDAIRHAQTSKADLLCFLDAGLEPVNDDWQEELMAQAWRADIAAVGGTICDRNHRILEGPYAGLHANDPGPHGRAGLAQNVSALSFRCLMLRRDAFNALNLLENIGTLTKADVLLSAALLRHGRLLWTPFAAFEVNA